MITALSLLERGFRDLTSQIAFVRAGGFLENFLYGLQAAQGGTLSVYYNPTNPKSTMVATNDIGAGETPAGLDARLHRHVGGGRDRHDPRRIWARGGATCRGDTVDCRRLDHLEQAVLRFRMTDTTPLSNLLGE